tara:strand:- start:123 stop:437 length:315 start_codon:yes stop_codon:yes gene_type:complete
MFGNIILDELIKYIPIRRCKNNYIGFISNKCPFCTGDGKRIFRYNTKLKVGKCYNCGFSFKEFRQLKNALNDLERYNKWLKDNECMNYRRNNEKLKEVDISSPF